MTVFGKNGSTPSPALNQHLRNNDISASSNMMMFYEHVEYLEARSTIRQDYLLVVSTI